MKSFWLLLLLSLLFLHSNWAGEEVLVPYNRPERWVIQPEEVLILQFDSRGLRGYWNTSAHWNAAYAQAFGHKYEFWSMKKKCRYGSIQLSASWCKVKAMLEVSRQQRHRAVLFLDSDAIMTVSYSVSTILSHSMSATKWDIEERPVAFNQDGPGFACSHSLKIGYNVCLNSGTVLWVKSKLSIKILTDWWDFATKVNGTRFRKDWREKWPWEQAPQYEILKKHSEHIQLLSFPLFAYLPWANEGRATYQYPDSVMEPYCVSHWLGAGCFITHFCASKKQKEKLRREYQHPPFPPLIAPIEIHYLNSDTS